MNAASTSSMGKKPGMFAKATPILFVYCILLSFGLVVFGYDASNFGGLQGFPGFTRRFGVCDAEGVCALPTTKLAIMNSFAWIGCLIGSMIGAPIVDRFGHRWAMFVVVMLNYIGAILEITSHEAVQFVVGRIIIFTGVSLVSVAGSTFLAELGESWTTFTLHADLPFPAGMRGFTVGSLQFFLIIGALVATGINKSLSSWTGDSAWRLAVGFTFLFPTFVLVVLPFVPHSPRWLIQKGRKADAVAALKRLRPKGDAELCHIEVEAIEEALKAQPGQLPWKDLVRGNNLRRTATVCATLAGQQLTGQAFSGQYAVVFYQSQGLGDKAFTYPVLASGLSLIAVAVGMYSMDKFGRRPVYLIGGVFQGLWLFVVAALGSKAVPSQNDINGLVAAVILFSLGFNATRAPAPYVTATGVPTGGLRAKTVTVGNVFVTLAGWLVSFTLPYLLNKPYAGLRPKVGYIYGSICCFLSVFAAVFIPETNGRSLEELDDLFDRHIPAWRFKGVETTGAAHMVATLETGLFRASKQEVEIIQQIHAADEEKADLAV